MQSPKGKGKGESLSQSTQYSVAHSMRTDDTCSGSPNDGKELHACESFTLCTALTFGSQMDKLMPPFPPAPVSYGLAQE